MEWNSPVAAALFGRDRKRAIASAGVALALFLVFVFVGTIAESSGLTNDWFARFPLAVLGLLVAIGVLAAGAAYWNCGLVSSWLVAFAPAFGWLWTVLVGEETAFPPGVAAPFGLAVLIAVPIGTVGYVAGRYLRMRPTEDWTNALPEPLSAVLLGADSDGVAEWGGRAVALCFAAAALVYVTGAGVVLSGEPVIPTGGLSGPFVLGPVSIPVWLGVATWPAYRGEGLLASWSVLFGPFLGAWVADDVLLGRLTGSGPLVDAVLVSLGAFVVAVLLGTVGFALGTGLRRATSTRGGSR